jgi:PBP1b-binding outer membrane lipoprotein LpoB
MTRLSAVSVLSAVVVILSGCSSHKPAAPSTVRAVNPPAWRAAMNDWFDNDRFDRPHSCAAVKEAARELPSSLRQRALPAFRRDERRVCK